MRVHGEGVVSGEQRLKRSAEATLNCGDARMGKAERRRSNGLGVDVDTRRKEFCSIDAS